MLPSNSDEKVCDPRSSQIHLWAGMPENSESELPRIDPRFQAAEYCWAAVAKKLFVNPLTRDNLKADSLKLGVLV